VSENLKREAARAALAELRPGMRLGLGSGSTAVEFVDLLGEKVRDGFECICVPTSERTRVQAEALGIPLSDLETLPELDLTVDGADEIGPKLVLIKGGGGALLREKIVAAASKRMIAIADASKLVDPLGAYPLPIEVNPFGFGATERAIAAVAGPEVELKPRREGDDLFVTDGGHYIVDACFGRIHDPKALSAALLEIPGVVQHGLFIGLCQRAYVASADGVVTVEP
jgi:ribose 5-phosphate isomerase A